MATATAMNKTIEGIVLSSRDYREHDAILSVLCKEEGLQSFVARGLRKLSSKNVAATQILTHAKFYVDFQEQKTMHSMRTADIIESYRSIREDLEKQAIASILCECIQKAELEEDAFGFLKTSLEYLQHTNQPYALLALYFACINRWCGIEPYVEGCVHCQSTKGIVGISLTQGGFVCHKCPHDPTTQLHTKAELSCFRLLCRAELEHFPILESYTDWTYEHFLMVYRFFQEYSGISIRSARFLSCIQELEGGKKK